MKHFHLSLVSILVIFACLALPSCKKKDAGAHAADAAAPVALKFAKMAKNPLFIDGNVIHLGYEVTIFSEASLRKSAPGWKCEEDESCTLEVKSDLDCTVKIVLNEDKYSVSQLTCVAKDGAFFPAETFPNGVWAADSQGIHFSASTDPMKRKAPPGCENCEEGTLEYDFEDMDDMEGWVVNFKSAEAIKDDEEEHGCDGGDGCEVSGSTYKCCTSDANGYVIVWDNDRGLVEYDGVAYGEKDGEFGNLSIKAK